MTHWLAVAVAPPAHSGLAEPLTYRADAPLAPGHIVRTTMTLKVKGGSSA